MKATRTFCILIGLAALIQSPVTQGEEKGLGYRCPQYDAAGPEKMEWFRDAKLGLFIHWGVYAVPAGFWSTDNTFAGWRAGKELYSPHDYSERLLHKTNMLLSEYEQIPELFNWSDFDTQQIIDLCYASGQRYIVITSKHHDGFAIWPTKVNDWNISDATPYGRESGRDPLKELAEACAKTKSPDYPWEIKLCFYYSHCVDWHASGAYPFEYEHQKMPSEEEFQSYLDRKVKPQLTELLTNYGDIGMIWFDVPRFLSDEQAKDLSDLVQKLSPNTIINGRIGRNFGNYLTTGDNGDVGYPVDYPWETPCSINHSYGYHSGDDEHTSPDWIIDKLIRVVSHGGNYLLNIGPKADGTIDQIDQATLAAVGKWLKPNSEAIFGTRSTPYCGDRSIRHDWGRCTQKDNNLYLIVTDWPSSGEVVVPLLKNEIKGIVLFEKEKRSPLTHRTSQDANGNDLIVIDVSGFSPQEVATVIRVECKGDTIELAPAKTVYDPAQKQITLDPVNLQAYASSVKSMNLHYDKQQRAVCNWRYNRGQGATLVWSFEVPEAGEYSVEFDYGSIRRAAGIPIGVLVDGEKAFTYKVANAKGWDKYETVLAGTVTFNKGRHDLALKLERSDVNSVWVMHLKRVSLNKSN